MSSVDGDPAGSELGLAGHLAENPFYLGYRYPPRELPAGTVGYDGEPIPLTLEDPFPPRSRITRCTPGSTRRRPITSSPA